MKNECTGSTYLTAFFGHDCRDLWGSCELSSSLLKNGSSRIRLVSYFTSPIGCICLSEAGHSAQFKEAAAFIS